MSFELIITHIVMVTVTSFTLHRTQNQMSPNITRIGTAQTFSTTNSPYTKLGILQNRQHSRLTIHDYYHHDYYQTARSKSLLFY